MTQRSPERMKGRARVCPVCSGAGVVVAPREQEALLGFLGGVRLPCKRCKTLGWIEESEIDCEAVSGSW